MTCAGCSGNAESVLLTVEGKQRVKVSLSFQEARVKHDAVVSKDSTVSVVESSEYDAEIGLRAPIQRI